MPQILDVTSAGKDIEDLEDQAVVQDIVHDDGVLAESQHLFEGDLPIPVVVGSQLPSMALHTAVVALDTSVVA